MNNYITIQTSKFSEIHSISEQLRQQENKIS